jgi:hypothetical protein
VYQALFFPDGAQLIRLLMQIPITYALASSPLFSPVNAAVFIQMMLFFQAHPDVVTKVTIESGTKAASKIIKETILAAQFELDTQNAETCKKLVDTFKESCKEKADSKQPTPIKLRDLHHHVQEPTAVMGMMQIAAHARDVKNGKNMNEGNTRRWVQKNSRKEIVNSDSDGDTKMKKRRSRPTVNESTSSCDSDGDTKMKKTRSRPTGDESTSSPEESSSESSSSSDSSSEDELDGPVSLHTPKRKAESSAEAQPTPVASTHVLLDKTFSPPASKKVKVDQDILPPLPVGSFVLFSVPPILRKYESNGVKDSFDLLRTTDEELPNLLEHRHQATYRPLKVKNDRCWNTQPEFDAIRDHPLPQLERHFGMALLKDTSNHISPVYAVEKVHGISLTEFLTEPSDGDDSKLMRSMLDEFWAPCNPHATTDAIQQDAALNRLLFIPIDIALALAHLHRIKAAGILSTVDSHNIRFCHHDALRILLERKEIRPITSQVKRQSSRNPRDEANDKLDEDQLYDTYLLRVDGFAPDKGFAKLPKPVSLDRQSKEPDVRIVLTTGLTDTLSESNSRSFWFPQAVVQCNVMFGFGITVLECLLRTTFSDMIRIDETKASISKPYDLHSESFRVFLDKEASPPCHSVMDYLLNILKMDLPVRTHMSEGSRSSVAFLVKLVGKHPSLHTTMRRLTSVEVVSVSEAEVLLKELTRLSISADTTEDVLARFARLGLKIIPTKQDGDCVFNSAIYQIKQMSKEDQSKLICSPPVYATVDSLRQGVVSVLLDRKKPMFQALMDSQIVDESKSEQTDELKCEVMIKTLLKSGRYNSAAGDAVPEALCSLLGVRIRTYRYHSDDSFDSVSADFDSFRDKPILRLVHQPHVAAGHYCTAVLID